MRYGRFAGRSEKGAEGSFRRTRVGHSCNAPVTMCNLYSITTNQAAIAALFRVINRYVGNLAPMPGVFPDYPAPPVVRDVVASVLDCRYPALISWALTGNT